MLQLLYLLQVERQLDALSQRHPYSKEAEHVFGIWYPGVIPCVWAARTRIEPLDQLCVFHRDPEHPGAAGGTRLSPWPVSAGGEDEINRMGPIKHLKINPEQERM